MTTENRIKKIVEDNIPLDPKCETKRKQQIYQRIQIRMQVEELIRNLSLTQTFEPRTEYKSHEPY